MPADAPPSARSEHTSSWGSSAKMGAAKVAPVDEGPLDADDEIETLEEYQVECGGWGVWVWVWAWAWVVRVGSRVLDRVVERVG